MHNQSISEFWLFSSVAQRTCQPHQQKWMLEQVQILLRCTTSKFTEYLVLSVAFDRLYDILLTHFAKILVDEIFVLLKKFANFANILQSFGVIFQRKYQRTCVYSTKTYVCNIKVLFEIYRMVLVWTPNSYVRCVLVHCEVTN